MNQLTLTAQLRERDALRFTPSGVAVTEAVFHHEGEVTEAGVVRLISIEVDTITVGALAQRVQALALGSAVKLTGFIAPRSRRSRKLRIHITDIELGA